MLFTMTKCAYEKGSCNNLYYCYFCVLFKRVELLNQSKKCIALLKAVEKKTKADEKSSAFCV